jgi:hypothetical protein
MLSLQGGGTPKHPTLEYLQSAWAGIHVVTSGRGSQVTRNKRRRRLPNRPRKTLLICQPDATDLNKLVI